ncbi:hypothetical protein KKA15_06760 [Patescibacteria group bacterium]|nr:hypothetical protein [Patescibacteria group bacterium]
MKISSIKLKKPNITALFSETTQSIGTDSIKPVLSIDNEKDKPVYIDIPPSKVILLPNRGIEIIIENNRLLINDVSTEINNFKKLTDHFEKVYEVFRNLSVKAYGFNFVFIIDCDEINFNKMLSNQLNKIVGKNKILKVGNFVIFNKNDKRIQLEITSVDNSNKQLVISTNVNHSQNSIPIESLKKDIQEDYNQLKEIINQLQDNG